MEFEDRPLSRRINTTVTSPIIESSGNPLISLYQKRQTTPLRNFNRHQRNMTID